MLARPDHRTAAAILELVLPSGEHVKRPIAFDVQSRQWIVQADITTPPGNGPQRRLAATGYGTGAQATATLQNDPLVGNTMLALVGTNVARSAVSLSSSGWTLLGGPTNATGSLTLYAKPVGVGEPRALTATATGAYSVNIAYMEYSNLVAPASVLDRLVTANAPTLVETLAIGPSGVLSQPNELVLLVLNSIYGRYSSPLPVASGDFPLLDRNDQYRMTIFETDPMAMTSLSSTMTWTGAGTQNALLATLKAIDPSAGNRNAPQEAHRFVEWATAPLPPPALPSLPVAPLGLSAVAGAASVSVTWNGVPGATGYRLYQDDVPVFEVVNYRVLPDDSLALTSIQGTLLEGLASGTYSYKVAATNRAGEGPKSGADSATIAGGAQIPTLKVAKTDGTLATSTLKVVLADGTLDDVDELAVR